MRDYRLYHLDSRGHVASRHEFRAVDDQAAIGHARADHDDYTCEIWELARRVALVPRDGPVQVYDDEDTVSENHAKHRGMGVIGKSTANIIGR